MSLRKGGRTSCRRSDEGSARNQHSESVANWKLDVDYLPMWADYSYPEQPTMVVWYGFESRPIGPARPLVKVVHKLEASFSVVVLFRKEHVEQVNGFPTVYWGWGYEDTKMQFRLAAAGLKVEHRKGTFTPSRPQERGLCRAQHANAREHKKHAVLNSRFAADGQRGARGKPMGLSSSTFTVSNRRAIKLPSETQAER